MFKLNQYFDGKVASLAFQTETLPATIGVMAAGEYQLVITDAAGTTASAKTNVKEPEQLASQLQLVLDGSIVVAQCGCEERSIRTARNLAELLITKACT